MTPTSGDSLLLLLTCGGLLCAVAVGTGWSLAAWRRPRLPGPRPQAMVSATAPSPAASAPSAPSKAMASRPAPPLPPARAVQARAASRPAPADRLMSLVDLMQQQALLVAIGQPLRAVQLLQSAAAGSQGDCVLPWLALLALQRSLGDTEGFQRDWLALQQRLGPVPSGALLQQDGETAAVERDPWLRRAVVEAWASDDPVPALHDLLFAPPRRGLLSLAACEELLALVEVSTHAAVQMPLSGALPPAVPDPLVAIGADRPDREGRPTRPAPLPS